MNIVKANVTFKKLSYNCIPVMIVIHNAGVSAASVESIHNYHLSKGWSGIGYNYYIRKDGVIYQCRPEGAEGAHTIGANDKSIGICCEGNFDVEEMTDLQYQSLTELCRDIMNRTGIRQVYGHKELQRDTTCPGKRFPLTTIKNELFHTISKLNIERLLNEMNIKELQRWLNRNGFTDYENKELVVDGVEGKRTKSAKEKAKNLLLYIMK